MNFFFLTQCVDQNDALSSLPIIPAVRNLQIIFKITYLQIIVVGSSKSSGNSRLDKSGRQRNVSSTDAIRRSPTRAVQKETNDPRMTPLSLLLHCTTSRRSIGVQCSGYFTNVMYNRSLRICEILYSRPTGKMLSNVSKRNYTVISGALLRR